MLWTATYPGDALDSLRGEGAEVTGETAAHLTPAQPDHINFYGTYSFDIDAELRREGHRPLRIPAQPNTITKSTRLVRWLSRPQEPDQLATVDVRERTQLLPGEHVPACSSARWCIKVSDCPRAAGQLGLQWLEVSTRLAG